MVIKTYSVCLDDEVVKKAKEKAIHYGGKLSPLLNELLKQWIEDYKGDYEE